MKLVSIDVGIRNFSFCCFELPDNGIIPLYPRIIDWQVLNLSGDQLTEEQQAALPTCSEIMKSGKKKNMPCGKRATMQMEHRLNSTSAEILPCFCCNVHYKKYAKQAKQIQQQPEHIWTPIAKPASTNAKKVDLTIVGRNIKRELDMIPALQNVDKVIVENQIGPLAIRMKAVQGMASQYFVMRNDNVVIDEISACNKLKKYKHLMPAEVLQAQAQERAQIAEPDEPDKPVQEESKENAEKKKRKKAAKAYKGRKLLSVIVARKLLQEHYSEGVGEGEGCLENNTNDTNNKWLREFEECGKKDDKADSFLQGLWYIEEILLKEQQKNMKKKIGKLRQSQKQKRGAGKGKNVFEPDVSIPNTTTTPARKLKPRKKQSKTKDVKE